MSGGKLIGRVVIGVSVAAFATALIGFFIGMAFDARTADFRAYGELPIGAETTMFLPKGDVNVSVYSTLNGPTDIDRVQVPDLELTVDPPEGVAQPRLDSYDGAASGDGKKYRKQIWIARIPADGEYVVKFGGDTDADGTIGQLVGPELAFGRRSSAEDWMYRSIWLWAASVVGLLIVPAVQVLQKRRQPDGAVVTTPSRLATGGGTRDQHLKALEALRDSGAITDREFTFEKRKLAKKS